MPTAENLNSPITERLEDMQLSETLQQSGVQASPSSVKPVVDDRGPVTISSSPQNSNQRDTIQLPRDPAKLLAQAKGSINDAITWLARLLLKRFKGNASNV